MDRFIADHSFTAERPRPLVESDLLTIRATAVDLGSRRRLLRRFSENRWMSSNTIFTISFKSGPSFRLILHQATVLGEGERVALQLSRLSSCCAELILIKPTALERLEEQNLERGTFLPSCQSCGRPAKDGSFTRTFHPRFLVEGTSVPNPAFLSLIEMKSQWGTWERIGELAEPLCGDGFQAQFMDAILWESPDFGDLEALLAVQNGSRTLAKELRGFLDQLSEEALTPKSKPEVEPRKRKQRWWKL